MAEDAVQEFVNLPEETVVTTTTQSSMQAFSLASIDTEGLSELKPIIMTMASMANMPEETPGTSTAMDTDTISVNMLASHLVGASSNTMSTRRKTNAVFEDSESGVSYEIVRGGTRRGGDKLIDSLGFSYNLKQGRGTKNVTYWWCAVRNSKLRCPAAVIERNGVFMRGKRKHEHLVGESTPRPHTHNLAGKPNKGPALQKRGRKPVLTKTDSRARVDHRYQLVKGGSKAGMDLLRDCYGYTYTLKKASMDGTKKSWRCSVRNSFLKCGASVVQVGNVFEPGQFEHKHMPGQSRPMADHEIAPSLRNTKPLDSTASSDEELDEEDEMEDNDELGLSGYPGYGSAPHKVYRNQRRGMEKKRREHETFLGPSCTINLTKCNDPSCNCKMVHCPFCDVDHFKPSKAGRVQDHLEMTHFAHGVQYDDLMIVKCFQDCNLERNYGHYHCVFCFQQILKRNAYARHMLRHLRKMGIPDRLLVLPDSKFPDVINAYGFEIPICKKTTCQPFRDKHYHCPQCTILCTERSLTVNHLWRCLQRKRDWDQQLSDEEDDMTNTVDDTQLNLHSSHVKTFSELPLEKCQYPLCCEQKYHCKLCPTSLFQPTYRQHLIAHYMSHWKQRVKYKGYSILKCYHPCDGVDRSYCKTRYHFHCPICCKIILTKGSFEEHLKSCHMLKFGENLIHEEGEDNMEAELSTTQASGPLTDDVEYMEDRLTTQALAKTAIEQMEKKRKYKYDSKSVDMDTLVKSTIKEIKKEISDMIDNDGEVMKMASNHDGAVASAGKSAKKAASEESSKATEVSEDEIFELGSAMISQSFVRALKSQSVVKSILAKVTGLTGTQLSRAQNGRYLISGQIEDLLAAKHMLVKTVKVSNDSDSDTESAAQDKPKKKKVLKINLKSKNRSKSKNATEIMSTKLESKKSLTDGSSDFAKKGKGKGKKDDGTGDDSFPYSEIKEIIEAAKGTGKKTKGKGRPPKKSSKKALGKSSSKIKEKSAKEAAAVPATPSRYGTRGIKRNYLEMNSGSSIKKEVKSDSEHEVESDDELEDDAEEFDDDVEESEHDDEETGSSKRRKATTEKGTSTLEEENVSDDDHEYLDDVEQEMEEESYMYEDDEDIEEDDTPVQVSHEKITDSSVQKLKTSNVTTSVPSVFKLGMKKVRMPVRKSDRMSKSGADNDELDEDDMLGDSVSCQTNNADKLKCSLCKDFEAESFAGLTDHLVNLHRINEPPRCDICEKDFDMSETMVLHLKRRHGPKGLPEQLKCTHEGCDKVFSSKNGLIGHYNRVHLGKASTHVQKKYNCEKCEYKCNSLEDLYEHGRVAHDEKIQCEICVKEFSTYSQLKAHNNSKHSDQEPQVCHVCSKQFSTKKSLDQHMRLHFFRLYKCDICNKSMQSHSSLKTHLETHKPESEREYKFICPYCGKKYAVKSNLNDHMNKHTGARPYQCNICQKSFGFRSMLMKHKTFVHTTERPYKCGFCMKGFKYMNLLRNHITTHTNQSKHVCVSCSKCFSTASTLKFHQQKCKGLSWKQDPVLVGQRQQNTFLLYTDTAVGGNISSQVTIGDQSVSGPAQQLTQVNLTGQQIALPAQPIGSMALPMSVPEVSNNITLESLSEHSYQQVVEYPELDVNQVDKTVETTTETVISAPPQDVLKADSGQEQSLEMTAAAMSQVEVFACSECSSTFRSFKEAEVHVLTAHNPNLLPTEMEVTVENSPIG